MFQRSQIKGEDIKTWEPAVKLPGQALSLAQLEGMKRDGKSAVIYIGAEWCTSCHTVRPTVDRLFKDLEPSVAVGSFDATSMRDDSALTMYLERLGVKSLPTLLVVTGKNQTVALSGAKGYGDYVKYLEDTTDISIKSGLRPASPYARRIEMESAISGTIETLRAVTGTGVGDPILARDLMQRLSQLREHSVKNGAKQISGTAALELVDDLEKAVNSAGNFRISADSSNFPEADKAYSAARAILTRKAHSGDVALDDFCACLRLMSNRLDAAEFDLASFRSAVTPNEYDKVVESPPVKFLLARSGLITSDLLDTTYLRALNLKSGETVAYIGVGNDMARARELARGVGSEGHTILQDIKKEPLRDSELLGLQAQAPVTLIQGEVQDTKIGNEKIDAAYMRDTYHHLSAPESMLKSLFKNLKPGGRLVIEEGLAPGQYYSTASGEKAINEHVSDPEKIIKAATAQGYRWENSLTGGNNNYLLVFRKPDRKGKQ